MEDVRTVFRLIERGDSLIKIDLGKPYFSIAIHPDFRKFLRFSFHGYLYEFRCLPFGLAVAPRLFTKILKPVFGILRAEGHRSVTFVGDFLCIASSPALCRANAYRTITLLTSLRFHSDSRKTIPVPAQQVIFLGLQLNALTREVSLPPDKRHEMIQLVQKFIHNQGDSSLSEN